MIEAVLFDLGDTLYRYESNDPRYYFRESISLGHAFLADRLPRIPPLPDYAKRVRWRMIAAFLMARLRRQEVDPILTAIHIHKRLGVELDLPTAEQLAARYFEPIRRSGRLDPDARNTLDALATAGYSLAVISNTFTPPFAIDDVLRQDGILEHFPVRIYSCQIGHMKPHPAIFREALRRVNVAAANAVYVGDKPKIDVRGAARVGMTTVLKRGDRTREPLKPVPDFVIDRLTELPPLLQNL